eukprot:1464145-Rhodomonas_salina.1
MMPVMGRATCAAGVALCLKVCPWHNAASVPHIYQSISDSEPPGGAVLLVPHATGRDADPQAPSASSGSAPSQRPECRQVHWQAASRSESESESNSVRVHTAWVSVTRDHQMKFTDSGPSLPGRASSHGPCDPGETHPVTVTRHRLGP